MANVLVSVGLIEKLQLSNSRKPVFRWRNRSPSEIEQSELIEGELVFQVKQEVSSQVGESLEDGEVEIKAETPSSIDLQCEEVIDGLKTSQSCDSDSFDDGSDSQSDCSSNGTPKRKYTECGSSTSPISSDDDMALKRSKTDASSSSSAAAATEGVTAESSPPSVARLLRFDASNTPVHPQIVLHEQQEQVRIYMQQYIREYVDHLIVQQAHVDPSSASSIAASGLGAESSVVSANSQTAESSVVTITQSIHGTPVTMPSLTNRVTSDLAGSIHDLLFSTTNTTSPQSVADLISVENRAATKNAPFVTISPVRSPPPAQHDASPSVATTAPTTVASLPSSKCPPLAPVKSTAAKAIDVHEQPRKLLAELQSTTTAAPAAAAAQS